MLAVDETTRSQASPLYTEIRARLRAYTNVLSILEKVEGDSHLSSLGSSFESIFHQEMVFAVSGRLIRAQATEGPESVAGHARLALLEHSRFQGEPEADRWRPKLFY
jgi:hypothetical protein